jgi:hypothetical protein
VRKADRVPIIGIAPYPLTVTKRVPTRQILISITFFFFPCEMALAFCKPLCAFPFREMISLKSACRIVGHETREVREMISLDIDVQGLGCGGEMPVQVRIPGSEQ